MSQRPPEESAQTDPRIQEILEFVLALAEGRPRGCLRPGANADDIDAIGLALNLLAETLERDNAGRARAEDLLRDVTDAYDHGVDLLCSVRLGDHVIVMANATLARALGRRPAQLVGQPIESIFSEDSRADVAEALRAICAGKRPAPVDLRLASPATRTGSGLFRRDPAVVVRAHGNVARDAHGTPVRVRLTLHDVTGERDLEKRLLAAQKLEALGRLAGGVAHDFNNLLLVMQGSVDSIVPLLGGRGADDVAAFREAATRAAQITRQLLAFARQDVVRATDVDVGEAIEHVRPILQRLLGGPISLEIAVDRGLPAVRLDETRLQQVLVNLVVNARDAMPDGGVVRITAQRHDRIVDDAKTSFVRLCVEDTGVGIPAEIKDSIFEPFFTTKEHGKGTGLGLATVYGILRQAGGDIDVDSAPGKGARFLLDLPISVDAPVPRLATPLPTTAPPAAGVVLVLEDDDRVRAITGRVLRNAGYTVLEAADADDALSAVRSNAVDVVVADVLLPGRTGPAIIEDLRRERPGFGVVFVSGYARDALDTPVSADVAFLQKPYVPASLVAAVRAATPARSAS